MGFAFREDCRTALFFCLLTVFSECDRRTMQRKGRPARQWLAENHKMRQEREDREGSREQTGKGKGG